MLLFNVRLLLLIMSESVVSDLMICWLLLELLKLNRLFAVVVVVDVAKWLKRE